MTESESEIGIYLYNLPVKEQLAIKRVVTFSANQGKPYILSEREQAKLVIVGDEDIPDFPSDHSEITQIIRIGDGNCQKDYDVLMQRPLLVTRVMRSLDDARKRLEARLKQQQPEILTDTVSVQPRVIEPNVALITPSEEESEEPLKSINKEGLGDEADSEPERPREAIVEQNTETATDQYHALIVDDSAAIRKQLELELRDANITADFAEDGEKALEMVASHHYDLIFLDIIMPGIDGYEACQKMRLMKSLKKTPIIMLSAKTSPLDEVQGVIAGASTYLTKPVKSDQLQKTLTRVSSWLDGRQQVH